MTRRDDVLVRHQVRGHGRERERRRTLGGMSRARSGIWRSPMTRMRKAIAGVQAVIVVIVYLRAVRYGIRTGIGIGIGIGI